MENTAKKTDSQSVNSIDCFLSERGLKKEDAVELIRKQQDGRNLTADEIESIAKTIYFTTFARVINLEYELTDAKGNIGCDNPSAQLEEEISSYGIELRRFEGDYAATRLASVAFQLANGQLFSLGPYECTNIADKIKKKHPSMWRPIKLSITPAELLVECEKKLEQYREYMISNLKIALEVNE